MGPIISCQSSILSGSLCFLAEIVLSSRKRSGTNAVPQMVSDRAHGVSGIDIYRGGQSGLMLGILITKRIKTHRSKIPMLEKSLAHYQGRLIQLIAVLGQPMVRLEQTAKKITLGSYQGSMMRKIFDSSLFGEFKSTGNIKQGVSSRLPNRPIFPAGPAEKSILAVSQTKIQIR